MITSTGFGVKQTWVLVLSPSLLHLRDRRWGEEFVSWAYLVGRAKGWNLWGGLLRTKCIDGGLQMSSTPRGR